MVIGDPNFSRSVRSPSENDSPLIVDADGMKAVEGTPEGFKPISRRDGQIGEIPCLVHLNEFSQADPQDGIVAARLFLLEESTGFVIAEGLDHKATSLSEASFGSRETDGPVSLTTSQSAQRQWDWKEKSGGRGWEEMLKH